MGLGQTLTTRRREHELAGDARAGSWARARARTGQRTFLHEHWKPVAGFAAFALAVGLVVCALTPALFLKA